MKGNNYRHRRDNVITKLIPSHSGGLLLPFLPGEYLIYFEHAGSCNSRLIIQLTTVNQGCNCFICSCCAASEIRMTRFCATAEYVLRNSEASPIKIQSFKNQ